jgi:hypothetical protein
VTEEVSDVPVTEKPRGPGGGAIVACVIASCMGLFLVVRVLTLAAHEIREDQRVAALDGDEPPEESALEAARLLRESEALDEEKKRVQGELSDLTQRLDALDKMAPKAPPIDTYVVMVKDGYAYLAAGSNEGVMKGYHFSVTRAGKFVARVVCQEVSDRAAACRIIVVREGDKITLGDEAKTLR